MIKVFSFRPEFFNQNGDQGNLEALASYTNSELESSSIKEADFVLFGDASRAAMREFQSELIGYLPDLQSRFDQGLPTLIVGSCFELLAPKLAGASAFSYGRRTSEFRRVIDDGVEVFGYRNSEVTSPDLLVKGAFVGTTLFGPVVAKNLGIAQMFADALGKQINLSDSQREWISKITSG